MEALVEYDSEARATYVSLDDEDPATQVEVHAETVAVDLNARGEPVGVEILLAPSQVTPDLVGELEDRFPGLGQRVAEALVDVGYHAV